jgi:hypothetical protein
LSSDQISWEEFKALAKRALCATYSDYEKRQAAAAMDKLGKIFLQMQTAADERNALREMLVDLGIENAKLSIDLAQEREFSKKPRQPAGFQVVGDSNGYGVATTHEKDELV